MSKINKEIIFLLLSILVITAGLFTETAVNTQTPYPDSQVGGLLIQFKDGVSESEVKAILQNYNMTRNYRMEYDTNTTGEIYYIMVDKDNWDIRDEINKAMKEEKKDWIVSSPAHVIREGDYYVFTVSEQAAWDKKFLSILNKYDIGVKKFTWCEIRFLYDNGPLTHWIPEEDAIRIKNELEKNEDIFTVQLSYIYSN
ncbi:UPF0228 family protein [Methanosarcina sp. MSH10X1]|uniref:UPF0228 family protein n=1 Tax=Methanosarcina sp. MSH10X1 TaxID=2507075 RepID=UPI000FFB26E3|nr:UPF0228 family protein [Methanosarcina sp. MSH10X1]RXA19853.1 UPF0228 family protein [Methanosarcina sp. MSH10X1]